MTTTEFRKAITLLGALSALSMGFVGKVPARIAAPTDHHVPLFLSASDPQRESFVRVINRSLVDGEVRIRATDDSGWRAPELTLPIAAAETVHFNSGDLENGNPDKGLTGELGAPMEGDWRLHLTSRLLDERYPEALLDLEVLAFVRTGDGMLTAMREVVAPDGNDYRVPLFNPGSNLDQVSRLRLINPNPDAAGVTIRGVDDHGNSPGEPLRLSIPPGAARTFSSQQIESGSSRDFDGALGDGHGKWRLTVTANRPIRILSLLDSPTGHITNLSTVSNQGTIARAEDAHPVWFFPSASRENQQGFVRVINHSSTAGEVRIVPVDDDGATYDPVTLTLDAGHAAQFNSTDLEAGNTDKGLSHGVGSGTGDWRLQLESDLDIEVLAYIRTDDGFVTAMHDLVPPAVNRHRVSTFNPGRNTDQVSHLRVINPNDREVRLTIEGIDGAGRSSEDAVETTVPANGARTYTAQELESGDGDGMTGRLGEGKAKWQLIVTAEAPLHVMSLLESPTGHLANLSARPPTPLTRPVSDAYERWNDVEPRSWWRESAPYSCDPVPNTDSPWLQADMPDLGGSDPLSLVRHFGNGTYVRYSSMNFEGCTPMWKYPGRTHLDGPEDPTYFSLGDLEIRVDIARVPEDAVGWRNDDGARVDIGMEEAVDLLNEHVARYYRKISEDKLRITFLQGVEFDVPGDGSLKRLEEHWLELIGADCTGQGCEGSIPGGLNRARFHDVESAGSASGAIGLLRMGLIAFRTQNMHQFVHEIGHAWMTWSHSYAELLWKPGRNHPLEKQNPYSNPFDFMSGIWERNGWRQTMPTTLAINRYAAGWIAPEEVALHVEESGTYTLQKPRTRGQQFLVVHSGRPHAFTTLEVTDERDPEYLQVANRVYDADTGRRRPIRYEGVLVSRYDQTFGTGRQVRIGPALHDPENPHYLTDVGLGRDDHAMIADGDSRHLGGGVHVRVSGNPDGSYAVTVSGGRYAEFEPWCQQVWFAGEYDTGCTLDFPR